MANKALRLGALAGLLAVAFTAVGTTAASAAPTVTLSADRTAVRPGTTVNFSLQVTVSPGATAGSITQLADSVIGPIDGRGTCTSSPTGPDFSPTVRTFSCTYPAVVTGAPRATQSHVATVAGTETYPDLTIDTPYMSASNAVPILLTKCSKKQKPSKGKCVKRK